MVVDDQQHVVGLAQFLQLDGQRQDLPLVAQLVPQLKHPGSALNRAAGDIHGVPAVGDLGIDDYVQAANPVSLLATQGRPQLILQTAQRTGKTLFD